MDHERKKKSRWLRFVAGIIQFESVEDSKFPGHYCSLPDSGGKNRILLPSCSPFCPSLVLPTKLEPHFRRSPPISNGTLSTLYFLAEAIPTVQDLSTEMEIQSFTTNLTQTTFTWGFAGRTLKWRFLILPPVEVWL